MVTKVIEFEKGIGNENSESSTDVALNSGVNSANGLIGKTTTEKLQLNCTKLQGYISS